MTLKHWKPALGSATILTVAVLSGTMITSPQVRADDSNGPNHNDYRIAIGLKIAPVKLKLKDLDSDKVGIGSYIVNAQADCNGCHTSPDWGSEYSQDPTFVGVPAPGVVNAAAYLGGGAFFGTFPGGANLFARNLTPDITGLPEGGHTLDEFINIIRTGHDYDAAHPACPATGAEGCILGPPATPLNGNVLQIMPWPTFSHMSDADLEAIYEYLKAIPCVSHPGPVPPAPGTPALPSILTDQKCPAPEADHQQE